MKQSLRQRLKTNPAVVAALALSIVLLAGQTEAVAQDSTSGTTTNNVGGDTTVGLFKDTGNAINGSANNSQVNNVSNAISNGNNNSLVNGGNQNYLISPNQAASNGGNSALVLPRNPLMLPNANNGRSNLGFQFGVNNNPGIGNLFGGKGNALGWFAQGGVTIPFGKVPDFIAHPNTDLLDAQRVMQLGNQRSVFGNATPNNAAPASNSQVQGRVVGLSAFNYSTIPTSKLNSDTAGLNQVVGLSGPVSAPQPKVIALVQADVYSHPLNKGDKIGKVEPGHEYAYLGHIKSGWVKVMLSNGSMGWTNTEFEYIKSDYTRVDDLANEIHPASKLSNRTDTSDSRDLAFNSDSEDTQVGGKAQDNISTPIRRTSVSRRNGHRTATRHRRG